MALTRSQVAKKAWKTRRKNIELNTKKKSAASRKKSATKKSK